MSIVINNNLPCVDFKLGFGLIDIPYICMLINSGTAVNSSNKHCHQNMMARYPNLVPEYFKCGPGANYDLVQLKVAVNQSAQHTIYYYQIQESLFV